MPAILELVKNKNRLDFAADRIRTDQWDLVCKSLSQDNALELLAVRSRKSGPLGREKQILFEILIFLYRNGNRKR